MNFKFLNICIFFAVVANVLWYYIKYIVNQYGYETHLFSRHGNDIRNLWQVIESEQDANKKSWFKILLFSLYAILFLTIVSFFMIVFFN